MTTGAILRHMPVVPLCHEQQVIHHRHPRPAIGADAAQGSSSVTGDAGRFDAVAGHWAFFAECAPRHQMCRTGGETSLATHTHS